MDTNPITLKSDERKLFDRGSVETFLYTTNKVSVVNNKTSGRGRSYL